MGKIWQQLMTTFMFSRWFITSRVRKTRFVCLSIRLPPNFIRQIIDKTTGSIVVKLSNNRMISVLMIYESVLSFYHTYPNFWKNIKIAWQDLQFNFETAKPNALKSCKCFKIIYRKHDKWLIKIFSVMFFWEKIECV